MGIKLVVSHKASIKINTLLEFYAERNKSNDYSKKLYRKLKEAFNLLKKQPYLGIKTNLPNTYCFIWGQFYIFFSVDKNIIVIESIYLQQEDIRIK